jgi:hypothetical protein
MKQIEFNLNSSERMENVLQKRRLSTTKGSRKIVNAYCHHQNLIFMNHHHL